MGRGGGGGEEEDIEEEEEKEEEEEEEDSTSQKQAWTPEGLLLQTSLGIQMEHQVISVMYRRVKQRSAYPSENHDQKNKIKKQSRNPAACSESKLDQKLQFCKAPSHLVPSSPSPKVASHQGLVILVLLGEIVEQDAVGNTLSQRRLQGEGGH